MLIGGYYRCPIPLEEQDREYPRFFVLAQVVSYDELADTVQVTLHDLMGSFSYYPELKQYTTFYAPAIARCGAMQGALVRGRWGNGTVLQRLDAEDRTAPDWYLIKLADGRCVRACETELKIDYSQMDYSPVQQLRQYEFQNPSWFLNRMKVSRTLHLLHHAIYGFPVLAGCRAYLLPHQISTVARCMETMPVRYMLADEVGLGKTVEACSILKVLRNETQGLRTLLIVPGPLAGQWKSELSYKFGLSTSVSPGPGKLCILPMEDLERAGTLVRADWDMVIVDETHRLLVNEPWYQIVQSLSRRTEHLLLLSATPIQDRKEEYRKLLALLHPEQYAEMEPRQFAWLVGKQKRIQRIVNQQLGRLSNYADYGELIQEKLQEMAETLEDRELSKLVAAVDLESPDGGLDMAKQALSYICENYRVERKVIRNRRQLITEHMAPRTLVAIPYTPLSADEAYNEIGAMEATLAYLTEHREEGDTYTTEVAIPLLGALFSSPWAFEEMLETLGIEDASLQHSAAVWRRQAEQEHRNVQEILDEDPDLIKGRLMAAMNYLDQETDVVDDPNCKIVVFTGYNATLTAFLQLFQERFGPMGVRAVGFGAHMAREELEDSVYAFQNETDCRVIVCDETGGEGRNFQNAQQILHLDLPWNANALEQRIGRLDRLGRDTEREVCSVVFYAEGTIEEQLFHIWKDGLQLFEQSLSGLEIITGELQEQICEALQDDFYYGLDHAFEEILEQAEEMRESVEDEQMYDIGATLYRPLSQGVEQILRLYSEGSTDLFAQAMMGWAFQVGLSAEQMTADGMVEFRQGRFSVGAAKQATFVPPAWSKYANTAILRRQGQLLGTFDRKLAAQREDILFYAPGDPLYDSIIGNAHTCGRGRCAAMQIPGTFRFDGFVFFFNVEVPVEKLVAEGVPLQTLAQFQMFLPLEQIVVPVSLLRDGDGVTAESILEALMSVRIKQADHLGRRGGWKGATSSLERFMLQLPPDKWERLVNSGTERALRIAQAKLKEQSEIATARNEMERIVNGHRAEALFFERDGALARQRAQMFAATLRAMKAARPVLDAVCFLRVREYGER